MPNAKSQMGPKTERTPGEWETSFNGKDWDICMEGGGDMIADLKDCPNAEANAAFIVKACNLHDELVDALKCLLSLCECGEGNGVWTGEGAWEEAKVAREVIAKAQEA